jgi:hypothetical protein
MDGVLKAFGEIAGVAGISVGLALYVFRDIIRKTVLKTLPPESAYRLMRMIVVAAWSLAVIGILARYGPLAIQVGQQNVQNVGPGQKP